MPSDVALLVFWKTQIDSAKPVMLEARMEIAWPIKTMVKPNMPVGRLKAPDVIGGGGLFHPVSQGSPNRVAGLENAAALDGFDHLARQLGGNVTGKVHETDHIQLELLTF